MDIGLALPTMASNYSGVTTRQWCARIDDAPFSSVSAGERLTFSNPELLTTLAAAAALTERVRILANVIVLPWHSVALVTKQLLTIEDLAPGRLEVGFGVGGRQEDYLSVPSSFAARHQRLDDAVGEFLRLWDGAIPDRATAPLGPSSSRRPVILAGALGPKSMQRAARWADGVTGFSIGGVAAEIRNTFQLADQAWSDAGRSEVPRKVTGCFYVLGQDAEATLKEATCRYLAVFGDAFAKAMAETVTAYSPEGLEQVIDGAAAAGADEVVLVPMSTDLACFDGAAEVVQSRSD